MTFVLLALEIFYFLIKNLIILKLFTWTLKAQICTGSSLSSLFFLSAEILQMMFCQLKLFLQTLHVLLNLQAAFS